MSVNTSNATGESAPAIYSLVINCEPLCGCSAPEPAVELYSSVKAARAALRAKLVGWGKDAEHYQQYYIGPGGGQGAKAAVKKLMAGEPLARSSPPQAAGIPVAVRRCIAERLCEAVAAMRARSQAENTFDFSTFDDDCDEGDSWSERWNADGTGHVRHTEEFVGCGSANQQWSVQKQRLQG